ncbi:uncharacterized protein LOC131209196 [Anopheles bellator]|uniref:uncharacterized protein LOC131209196 n=1 Tax=Anopheles bellator TaxID=139047 RepID=UPI00264A3AC9|nr:uncharacterized protein LOC131209196 [Anopheles bellator]
MSTPCESFPQSNSKLYSTSAMNKKYSRFRPVLVIFMFSVHLVFAMAIVGIGLAGSILDWPSSDGDTSGPYFYVIYLRVLYWLLAYVIHARSKREFGKLVEADFDRYRTFSVYRKAPLQIVTIWNVILLTVQNQVRLLVPYDQLPKRSEDTNASHKSEGIQLNPAITPQVFVTVVCALELLVLLCFYVPLVRTLIEVRSADGQHKDTDLRYRRMTDTELAEQPIDWQLDRHAELIKQLRNEYEQLQREAKLYGVDGSC